MTSLEAVSPAPPGFIRSFSGELVRASRNMNDPDPAQRKFLIVLQYYDGDVSKMNDLGLLIGELERQLNEEADILLFARYDVTRDFSPEVRAVLSRRFRVIHDVRSSRRASGYPYGANEMFCELLNIMSTSLWRDKYYAFINLEWDCVPTGPDWISRLIAAWKPVAAAGKLFAGHFQPSHAIPHFNGVAIYDTDIFKKVRGNALLGCDGETAYDMAFAPVLNQHGADIPEIFLCYRQATALPHQIFSPRRGGVVPAIFHGVQDESAMTAVRAKHVANFHAGAPTAIAKPSVDTRVFCYQDFVPQFDQAEVQAELAVWRSAWSAAGWQPIVLSMRDASLHPLYAQFAAKIASLPSVNAAAYETACWMRWLALDVAGAGLQTDYDVLPNGLTPDKLPRDSGFRSFQNYCPCMVLADKEGLAWWISEILAFKVLPSDTHDGRSHISDQNFLLRLVEAQKAAKAKNESDPFPLLKAPDESVHDYGKKPVGIAVHFCNHSVATNAPGRKRSEVMKAWLGGEAWTQ